MWPKSVLYDEDRLTPLMLRMGMRLQVDSDEYTCVCVIGIWKSPLKVIFTWVQTISLTLLLKKTRYVLLFMLTASIIEVMQGTQFSR